ncbi:hypothetical protein PG988_003314 [Apiospora saccharicola]
MAPLVSKLTCRSSYGARPPPPKPSSSPGTETGASSIPPGSLPPPPGGATVTVPPGNGTYPASSSSGYSVFPPPSGSSPSGSDLSSIPTVTESLPPPPSLSVSLSQTTETSSVTVPVSSIPPPPGGQSTGPPPSTSATSSPTGPSSPSSSGGPPTSDSASGPPPSLSLSTETTTYSPTTSPGPSEPPPPGGQNQPSSSTQPSLSLSTSTVTYSQTVPVISSSLLPPPPRGQSASQPPGTYSQTGPSSPPPPPPGGQGLPSSSLSQTGPPLSSLPPPPGGPSSSEPPATYSQTIPVVSSSAPPPPGGQSPDKPGRAASPRRAGSAVFQSNGPRIAKLVRGRVQELPCHGNAAASFAFNQHGYQHPDKPRGTSSPSSPSSSRRTGTAVNHKRHYHFRFYDRGCPPSGSETAPTASNSIAGSMSISTITGTVSVSTSTDVVTTVTDCIPLPGLGPGGQAGVPSGCPPWSLSIGSGSSTFMTETTDIATTASTDVPIGSGSVPITTGTESSLVTFPPPTETLSLTTAVTVSTSSGAESSGSASVPVGSDTASASQPPSSPSPSGPSGNGNSASVSISTSEVVSVSVSTATVGVSSPTGWGSKGAPDTASASYPGSGLPPGTGIRPPPIITGSLPPFMNTSSSSSSSSPPTGPFSSGVTASVTATVSITSTAIVVPPPNGQQTTGPPVGSDTTCTPTTFSTSVRPSRSYPDSSASDTTCTTDDPPTPTLVHFGNITSAIPTSGPGIGLGGDDNDAASYSYLSRPVDATDSVSATGIDGSLPTGAADSSGFVTVLTSSSIIVTEAVPTASASVGLGGPSSSSGDSGAASSTSSSATCSPTQDTVMIENGGFERGLSPWQVGAFEPLLTDYYITKPDVDSGSEGSCRSLAVDLLNGGDNWGAQWWDFELRSPVVIRLSPSPQRYVLSFSLKFAIANQARVVAVLDGERVATVVAERDSSAGAGAWTQWGVTFELGAKRNFAVLRFEYYLNGASENTIWIDGIDISPYLAALPIGNETAPASPSSRMPLAETAVVAVQTTKSPGS